MCGYLPVGQKLWVCAQCKLPPALKNSIYFPEAKVIYLEKQERDVDGTFRNKIEMSLLYADSSSADIENKGLEGRSSA